MRHQLFLQQLEPQYLCTLRPLVWNIPCCPPDEVLPPSFRPGLSPAGLLCTPPQPRRQSQLLPELPEPQAGAQDLAAFISLRAASSPWHELLENGNLALLMAAAPWLAEPGTLLAGQGLLVGGWEGGGGGQWRVAA